MAAKSIDWRGVTRAGAPLFRRNEGCAFEDKAPHSCRGVGQLSAPYPTQFWTESVWRPLGAECTVHEWFVRACEISERGMTR